MEKESRFSRKGLFANPITKKLRRSEYVAEGDAASYRGVAVNTLLLLLTVMIGGALGMMVTDPMLMLILGIASLVVMLLSPLFVNMSTRIAPAASVIGSLAMGYAVGFAGYMLPEFSDVIFLAAVLTVAIVLSMMCVYFSGMIKVTAKFKRVLYSLLLASVIGSLMLFILFLIPATRSITAFFLTNPLICLLFSVLGVLLASFFLLSDFDDIERVVGSGLPRAYEWSASYSLVITVVWLYLEIFDLIMTIRDLFD